MITYWQQEAEKICRIEKDSLNSELKTWVDANYSSYSAPEDFHDAVTDNSAEAKAFYSALSAAIKAGTVSISATKEATATGTASYPVTSEKLTGSVEFTGCEMGTYLILIEFTK